MPRIIAHLDMDAFFASVEEVTTPRFLGKPLVVGSEIIKGVGRGVVSTANYKAREYGIRSAMPITKAWQLSQEAKRQGKEEVIFLPVDFELYHKVSAHVLEIIHTYSGNVEQASVDEFYFDLSGTQTFKQAETICKKIKAEIKQREKVTCSVGIAPNKMVAKIAAGMKKPDGLLVVEEKEVEDFLNPLDISELPGVGPKTAEILHKKNIKVIKDLLVFSKLELQEILGKHGEKLYEKIRGIDPSPVSSFHQVKSIGEQTTLQQNSLDALLICETLRQISTHVFKRFQQSEFSSFKTITIIVRFADFKTYSTSKSFTPPLTKTDHKKFNLEILKLILPFLDLRQNPKQKAIRLTGVRVENLIQKQVLPGVQHPGRLVL